MADEDNETNNCEQNVDSSEMDMLNEMAEIEELFHEAEAATVKSREYARDFLDEDDDPFFDCVDHDEFQNGYDGNISMSTQHQDAAETVSNVVKVAEGVHFDITKKGCLIRLLESNREATVKQNETQSGGLDDVMLPLVEEPDTQPSPQRQVCATPKKKVSLER